MSVYFAKFRLFIRIGVYNYEVVSKIDGRTISALSLGYQCNRTYIVQLSAFDRNGNSLFRELGTFSSVAFCYVTELFQYEKSCYATRTSQYEFITQ